MSTEPKIQCDLCPRRCNLSEGQVGFCKARAAEDGKIKSLTYGKILALALDPIEKKPLSFYKPGSWILSAGTFGCNMNCAFCQNFTLARAGLREVEAYDLAPEELVQEAVNLIPRGNIGIAFTYNEPTVNFEYVRDTFRLAKEAKLDTVLVTNGQLNDPYLDVLLPLTSAWNIDLKSFSEENYRKLGGDLSTTLNTIQRAAETSHVELTTLVVPGISDDLEDFEREIEFIASIDPNLPLHLSRYFPRYHYSEPATSIELMLKMQTLAEKKLTRVVLGNI